MFVDASCTYQNKYLNWNDSQSVLGLGYHRMTLLSLYISKADRRIAVTFTGL